MQLDSSTTERSRGLECSPRPDRLLRRASMPKQPLAPEFAIQGVAFGIDAGLKCSVLLLDEQVMLSVNTGAGL